MAHRRQPFERVADPDRQLGDHRRDLVVGGAVTHRADRHGHERTEHGVIGIFGSGRQQVAEGPGDHGQDDVVDGPSERLLDRLDVGELGVGGGPAPMGPIDPGSTARVEASVRARGNAARSPSRGAGSPSSRRPYERTRGADLLDGVQRPGPAPRATSCASLGSGAAVHVSGGEPSRCGWDRGGWPSDRRPTPRRPCSGAPWR